MKQISVGVITKPQGIHGEVKVHCYVDAPAGFSHIDRAYVGGRLFRVLRSRVMGAELILSLEGVADRNAAELLRGQEVTVDRALADSLKKGDYFICDLVGLSVLADDGTSFGAITDVLQHGAADVFVIEGQGRTYMVPFLKRLVLSVDLSEGVMVVSAAVWREVCCEN